MIKVFTCPKCNKEKIEHPALSRRDNKTEICSQCGLEEAVEDFEKNMRESNS